MDVVDNFINSFQNDDTINVALEDDHTLFKVPRAILYDASNQLPEVFRSGFTANGTLRLPGCDTDVFKLFLYWHCRKEFPDFEEEILRVAHLSESTELANERVHLLIRLWMFGDAYLMPKLQNAVMHYLGYLCLEQEVTADMIHSAYQFAPSDSPIRKLFCFAALHEYFHAGLEPEFESLTMMTGFLEDFMKPIRKLMHEDVNAFDHRIPVPEEFKKYMV